jgi:1-acyl-sn-glycerol-3-phosphate acyltransferase
VSRVDLALFRDDALPGRERPSAVGAGASPGSLLSRAPRIVRLLRVGLHIARGAAIAAFVFPFAGREARRAHVQRWSRQVLDIFGVSLRLTGLPPHPAGGRFMIVANHVSWLDIIAINAVLPARFVAKSEVRAWPVIGWLSEKAGTLFIRRARRRDAARISGELAQLVRDGEPMAVFPEATSGDGSTVLKFHASLLQAAVLAAAAVHPVALRYARPDGTRCAEAAYFGGMSLWESLNLVATQPATLVFLDFLPPLESAGRDRRQVAAGAREAILRSLFPPSRDSRS